MFSWAEADVYMRSYPQSYTDFSFTSLGDVPQKDYNLFHLDGMVLSQGTASKLPWFNQWQILQWYIPQ